MFDSIAKTLEYIKQTISEMIGAKSTLLKRIDAINATIKHCQYSGNQECIGKMILAKAQTEALLREHESLMVKLGPFRSYIETTFNLGVFPFFIGAGAAALATALYTFLSKVKNEGKALELIQQGYLKPSEAKSILSGGGISDTLDKVSNIAFYAVMGYAAFMILPLFFKKG